MIETGSIHGGRSLGRFNPVAGNVTFADAEITITAAPGLGITTIAGLEPIAP